MARVNAAGPNAQRCARALAAFYEEAGAEGGREGHLFGMRVSHVALAMHEGRSAVGLERPLIGLVDVALHDAILPLASKARRKPPPPQPAPPTAPRPPSSGARWPALHGSRGCAAGGHPRR